MVLSHVLKNAMVLYGWTLDGQLSQMRSPPAPQVQRQNPPLQALRAAEETAVTIIDIIIYAIALAGIFTSGYLTGAACARTKFIRALETEINNTRSKTELAILKRLVP